MLRPIARLLVLTLVLGSGRLLACGWECGVVATAAVEVACHNEPPDAGPLLGGVVHQCPPETNEPVFAAANKVEQQVIGAFVSPSQWIGFDPPAIGRVVNRTIDHRVSVPPPSLFNVLRI
jgi:hypothetical protein